MNKIKIILKESGTVADLSMNFKIYQGSAKNVLLDILVPKSIVSGKLLTQYVNANGDIQTQNGMYTGVKLGMVYIERDGKLGKTQNYYIRYLKDISNSDGEFLLYERLLPTEFCLNAGTGINAPKLVINVENILNNVTVGSDGEAITNEPIIVSLITSQTCQLDIYPSTNLDIDPPAEPSEFDLLNAEVDALVQNVNQKSNIADTVLKYNVLEDLPNTVLYDKNGYKSIGVLFYNETYSVPITKNTTDSKQGSVMVTDIRPHDTEQYWVLQDEVFTYDTGAVKRTITINAVQQEIGQYTVVSVGEWKPVNSDWLNEMDARVVENSADIDSLMGRSSRYVVHLGDNTSPSQEELQEAFEEASGLTTPLDGTTLLDLDNNKEYTYFTSNGLWNDRGASTVTLFTEIAPGIIKSSTQDGYVSSANGEGKVNGWAQVKQDIENNETNANSRILKTDFTKVAVNKTVTQEEGENSATIITAYKNATNNATSTEEIVLEGTDSNIEVSVNGNKVTLKANEQGVSTINSISMNDETPIGPDSEKVVNLPAFQRTDTESGATAQSGIVSAEQADLIAFKSDAQNIADSAVAVEKNRAMSVETVLNSDIETNAENIQANSNEIAQVKQDYVPKSNFTDTLVTSDDFEVSTTGALQHTETKVDAKTGEVSTEQKTAVPVVNGQARLFLPQEQETLQELDQWRASMQGEALSYQTDLSDIPSGETSSSEVQNYLTQKYYTLIGTQQEPLDQTTLTDEAEGVTYKWYSNDDLWYLSHGSPSSLATNNMYDDSGALTASGNTGVVIGSNRKYHVLAETNGELAVNGLDALDERVTNNTTAINNEITNRQNAVQQESTRAQSAEQANASAISNETTRAQSAESTLDGKITAETSRAQSAEQELADDIEAETTRAQTAEQVNANAIATKVDKATTVAGKPLSGNVTLDSLTIQQNGVTKDTYNGNGAKTINITTPTKTSDLTNDGDGTQVSGNTDPYAKISQIPTNNNQLANGAGYATLSQVPTKISDLQNDSGFINEVDDVLSTTSSNPVQNSVITKTLDNKQNKKIETTKATFKVIPDGCFAPKNWNGINHFSGQYIWSDGDNVYYSEYEPGYGDYVNAQYVLDKSTSTWSAKTWSGLTSIRGEYIWTDGINIYYSYDTDQFVLDKSTSIWNVQTWSGLTNFYGNDIWTDGDNIYYSSGSTQYVLDKTTSTWNSKTWNGLTSIRGEYIWTDGNEIYYSSNNLNQYVLDKSTFTWSPKTWNGYDNLYGEYIWTDGENIYHSINNQSYVLDKYTSTWSPKTWNGVQNLQGHNIWTDGANVYYSNGSIHRILTTNKIMQSDSGEVVETYYFYRWVRYTNGKVEIIGRVWATASNNGVRTVTFPFAFEDNNYTVALTRYDIETAGVTTQSCQVVDKTTTNLTVRGSSTAGEYWYDMHIVYVPQQSA